MLELFVCFWKNCFALCFPSFFGHDIRVNIKKCFHTYLRRFFSQHFLLALLCVTGKIVSRVFPPLFWSRYSCEYKTTCFWTFFRRFPPNIICSHYSCVSGTIVSRVFSLSPFFGHDIRVNIKNVFSNFFETIFFKTFFARTIRVFLEKLFHGMFFLIFWSRYSCEYKKRVFALF